jgi:hypothetical protein
MIVPDSLAPCQADIKPKQSSTTLLENLHSSQPVPLLVAGGNKIHWQQTTIGIHVPSTMPKSAQID